MGCDYCAKTRPVAVRPAETAPGLARLSVSSSTKLIRGHWACGDTGRAGTQGARGHRARGNVRRLVLSAERVTRNGAVGDEPVLQTFEQALGFGCAIDSVAAEAVLGGDDARVFQAQECLVGG